MLSRPYRWVTMCMLLCLALRLFRIGHQNLWIDEMISYQLATYTEGAEFWRGLLRDIHGPLTSALLHGWVRLGSSEAWMRLLYTIPALLTIPVMYELGRVLFHERGGRVASLALAVSPFHVWYSQEIRSYTWAILWITIASWLFVRLWDGDKSRAMWLKLGAVLLAGVLTNYAVTFLIACLGLLVLVRRPFSREFVFAWIATVGLVCFAFLPWFIDWFQRLDAERVFVDRPPALSVPIAQQSGLSWAAIPYVAWTFVFGHSLGPSRLELSLDQSIRAISTHLPVLVPGLLAVGIAMLLGLREARERGRLWIVLTVVLLPLLLTAFLAFREIKTFRPRYLVACYPVLVALLSAGWSRPGRWARLSAVVVLGLTLLSLGQHFFDSRYAKEDLRSAARLILQEERPGDTVVVIYSFRPFRYYFRDTALGQARLLHLHKRFLQTDEQVRDHAREAGSEDGRVWLVLARWREVAPWPRLRALFEEVLDERRAWDFHGVKVFLFEPAAT